MTNKDIGKLFFQALLLLILLFGLVRLVMIKEGSVVVLELLVLAFLLILSVVGLATHNNSGSKILFVVFLVYTGNLLLLWGVYKSLFLVLFLVSLLGLGVSWPSKSKEAAEEPAKPSAPPQKVVDGKVIEAKVVEDVKKEKVKEEKTSAVKTTFTPGKYVASKRSNVYHEPKCEWAKKIQKDRKVWFPSREEALNKGYKKHNCVDSSD